MSNPLQLPGTINRPRGNLPMKTHFHITIISAFFLLTLIATGIFPCAARAAVDAKGAQHLKTMFETILKQHKADIDDESMQLKLDGTVMVEPAGDYYAVTLPHLSAIFTDGGRANLGIISLNVMPTNDPLQWKMTLALPSPITFYDTQEKAFTVTVGKQYFAGIWHEKFENFIKLKAQYKNVILRTADNSFNITVPDISSVYDMSENASTHLWSGPMQVSLSGLQVSLPDGGKADIGKITGTSTMFDYSVDTAAAYRENLRALNESYGAGEDSVSKQHVSGIYSMVTEFMGKVWDGFTMSVEANDIFLTRPPIPGSPEGELKLSRAGFAFDMTGFRKNSVTLRLTLNYDGFSLKPVPLEFSAATATHMNVDISLNKLPFNEIAGLGKTSIESAVQAPDMAQLVGIQALLSLPQLFTKAGTTLDIKDTAINGNDYSVLMNASLNADINALKAAVGKGRMEVTGLEKIIALTNEQLKKPGLDPEKKERLQNAIATLGILQIAGQQGKDAQGKLVRTYDFELNKEGQILLNGTDLTLLLPKDEEPAAAAEPSPAPKKK